MGQKMIVYITGAGAPKAPLCKGSWQKLALRNRFLTEGLSFATPPTLWATVFHGAIATGNCLSKSLRYPYAGLRPQARAERNRGAPRSESK